MVSQPSGCYNLEARMPSIYDIKPKFQSLLRPIVNALARAGVQPNAVTLAAISGSIVVGWLLTGAGNRPRLLLLMPAWLFLRMALNAIDGMLAREHNRKTTLGEVLNEAGDVVSDVALYLPIGFVSSSALVPAVAFAFGAVFTEFCGVLASGLGAGRRYDGPMGKSDRAFLIGALMLATFLFPNLIAWWSNVLLAGAALTLVTCWNRLSKVTE